MFIKLGRCVTHDSLMSVWKAAKVTPSDARMCHRVDVGARRVKPGNYCFSVAKTRAASSMAMGTAIFVDSSRI